MHTSTIYKIYNLTTELNIVPDDRAKYLEGEEDEVEDRRHDSQRRPLELLSECQEPVRGKILV